MKLIILILTFVLASCTTVVPASIPAHKEAPDTDNGSSVIVQKIKEQEVINNDLRLGSNESPLKITSTLSMPPTTTFTPNVPLVKTREFLYKNELEDFPVYGVLVFSSKPSNEEQKKQYEQICNSWEATFLTKKEARLGKFVKTFTTYWPTIVSKENELTTCDDLYNYDYAYAQQLMSDLKINRPGPMLVAIYSNNGKITHTQLYLNSLELEDINRTFQIWKFELTVTENGWSSTFNITYLREKFRYLIKSYGEAVLEFNKG